jgi:hypothetical protein
MGSAGIVPEYFLKNIKPRCGNSGTSVKALISSYVNPLGYYS